MIDPETYAADFCIRCGKVCRVRDVRIIGGWKWVCCDCGQTTDMDFEDDGLDGEYDD